MITKTETYTAQLTNISFDSGDKTNATFRLNMPNKRASGYDKITLYLDAFNVDLFQTNVNTVLIQASNILQKNSLSSITKGSITTIGQASRPIYRNASNNIVEKLDNVEYYGPNTPIEITGIPTETTISLKSVSGGTIDLQTNGNHYHIRLRFVCEYTEYSSMDM
jgi:hypothetical protein